jgi:hypothetical protein
MNPTIKATKKQVASVVARTFPNYHGRKFVVEVAERVTFYDTNWSGGTCNKYAAVTRDGQTGFFTAPAPWVNALEGQTVDLPVDVVVVAHEYYCGQDCGLRFYVHPDALPKLLPDGGVA